jgi:cytochrome c oxidase cbb3-type subunit III
VDSNNKNDGTHGEDVHVYDGIVEQNNPMPDWWIWLFFLCIIFAFVYWLHYFTGNGPTLLEEYNVAMKKYEEVVAKGSSNQVETEESLMAYMKGETALTNGASIFTSKCAMCHGDKLEGKIGPNLTDTFWVTGDGSRQAVYHTIAKGSAAKGMPPWEGMLKPNELKDVTAFVYSKIGSNPPNAKAPEGIEAKK